MPLSASTPEPDADLQVFDGVAGVRLGDVLLTLWRTPARVKRVQQVQLWTRRFLDVAEKPLGWRIEPS